MDQTQPKDPDDQVALIDRAKHFIEQGHPSELPPLLSDCVRSQDTDGMLAVQLLARDMYGGETLNLLLKSPAAHCLLAWRHDGLQALVENAMDEPTLTNFTLAFKLLASTANGCEPISVGMQQSNPALREAVSRSAGDWEYLALPARRHLNKLMLSIEDDQYAALYTATAMQGLAVLDPGATGTLSHALALRSTAVGPKILTAYNAILNSARDDEAIFQRFFAKHPLLLDPRAFQVWAKPDFHGRLEPDFVIRRYDNSYVIVEIETPAKLLVTQRGHLSANTTHAINQVLEYQEYLRTHLAEAIKVFPQFTSSTGLVVIGHESSLNAKQNRTLRMENQGRPHMRIVGFDSLADTARAVTDNVIHGIPATISGTRLP